jgi:hypothetical protein
MERVNSRFGIPLNGPATNALLHRGSDGSVAHHALFALALAFLGC